MMLLLLDTKTRAVEVYHPKWNAQVSPRQVHHNVWRSCTLNESLSNCTLIYAASEEGQKITDLAEYESFEPTQIEMDALEKALIEQELKKLKTIPRQ